MYILEAAMCYTHCLYFCAILVAYASDSPLPSGLLLDL